MNMMKKGEMLTRMLMLATQRHAGQYDKGGQPYILHPLKVMYYLKTDDEELQCIAVGHDLKEDCCVTDFDFRFHGQSERVIVGINALTNVYGETEEEKIVRVCSNKDAMLVKLCDLRHNTDIRRLKGITEKDTARMARYHRMYTVIKEKLK